MAITRDGYAQASVGIDTVAVTTGDIPTGSWMIAVWNHNSTSKTETPPAGWTTLVAGALSTSQIGSRRYSIYGKIRGFLADGSADPTDTGKLSYAFVLSPSADTQRVGIFWGKGVRGWQVGTSRKRNGIVEPDANAENYLAISNSVTTTEPGTLMLSFAAEATSAPESAITSIAGATEWAFLAQGTGGNTGVIETIHASYKDMPTAGSTGPVTIRYPNGQATNAGATQIILLPAVESIPTTSQVKAYADVIPAQTSVSMASKQLTTGTVEAILYDAAGTTELQRKTVAHDSLTRWGNATFTGLTPATSYTVRYAVNGTLQTDADRHPRTLPAAGAPVSFRFVAGSCQFTGSNHPVFDRMREEAPVFIDHGGDVHYADATTDTAWRAGMDSSFSAARFNQMLDGIPMYWSMDNHDRIMTNPGGAGTALNLGETDPLTAAQWKHLAGSTGWASPDGLGRAWQVGRVLFVHLDQWTARDDPDFDPEPRTFLGATQKQWFKDTLAATDAVAIVWFCQWTARNNGNGRWNSFPTESAELEAWLNARPGIKRRMVLIGGDSHSPQAGTGDYGGQANYRFVGIPSLNFSGYNRSGDDGDGSTGWDIINEGGRPVGSAEADYGLYSLVEISDVDGHLRLSWYGCKVDATGTLTRRAYFRRSYGQPFDRLMYGGTPVDQFLLGNRLMWKRDEKGLL